MNVAMVAKTVSPYRERVVDLFPTALGWMGLVWRGRSLELLTFGHARPPTRELALHGEPDFGVRARTWQRAIRQRLEKYAEGREVDFSDLKLAAPPATRFARRVIELCRAIPFGSTMTYAELAAAAGSPRASRAVGNVMRTNRVPLVVPCHRVVGANGSLGGYSAPDGLRMKEHLLALEGGFPDGPALKMSRPK